jgi:histidinol phosphatase-like PHP family hydrolase
MLSINTDAHGVDEFAQIPLGISVARRAGAEPKNVINTWRYEALVDFFAKKR